GSRSRPCSTDLQRSSTGITPSAKKELELLRYAGTPISMRSPSNTAAISSSDTRACEAPRTSATSFWLRLRCSLISPRRSACSIAASIAATRCARSGSATTFLLSSANLRVLGIRGSFTLELTKMLVEEIVGDGDHPVVPRAPLPALVAADQQDRGAARVESEQHADVTYGRDQFLHVLVSRLLDRVHERPPE